MSQQLPTPGRQNVTQAAREAFNRMLDEREAEGIAKYGTTLQTHNGRDAHKDLAEELIDAWQYARQAEMERADLLARAEAAEARAARLVEERDLAQAAAVTLRQERDDYRERWEVEVERAARLEAEVQRLRDEYEPEAEQHEPVPSPIVRHGIGRIVSKSVRPDLVIDERLTGEMERDEAEAAVIEAAKVWAVLRAIGSEQYGVYDNWFADLCGAEWVLCQAVRALDGRRGDGDGGAGGE